MYTDIKKVIRFISIYGIVRTLTKVSGRKREFYIFKPFYVKRKPTIGLVGCGQFQFSTIAYYLSYGCTNRFSFCYDPKMKNAVSLAKYFSIPKVIANYDDIFTQDDTKLVYIASNHSTHSKYAEKYLRHGVDVYCEKPLSVTFGQLDSILESIKSTDAKIFVGYNRPYSKAICDIKKQIKTNNNIKSKFSLSCFISAHKIPENHWYRESIEGSRICGNVGHWIDLMIHMYNWRGYIPTTYYVNISYSSVNEPDDNISISMVTPEGDLTSIVITSRSEPFDGINESINFQYGTVIAKIDDFRVLKVWDKDKYYMKKYYPKDVGHRRSVMQPFEKVNRDFGEIVSSTELMLHIAEMVKNKIQCKEIRLIRNLI